MKIELKKFLKEPRGGRYTLCLNERLPRHIESACELDCHFYVESVDDYYIVKMNTRGLCAVTCQRCLEVFDYDYHQETQLAMCAHDARAEELLTHFDTIVVQNGIFDLTEILTDDLHLLVPSFHPDIHSCDENVSKLLDNGSVKA